jgi:hypothetical protein
MSETCNGEPHTCDQERIVVAEGRTDRLTLELRDANARVFDLEERLDVLHKGFATRHIDITWIDDALRLLRDIGHERDARLLARAKWEQRLAALAPATEEQG